MLGASLAVVFVAFCTIMGAVLIFCIRERRLVDGLGKNKPISAEAMEAADQKTVVILFGAIIVGAVLALVTGYLVFFRKWA